MAKKVGRERELAKINRTGLVRMILNFEREARNRERKKIRRAAGDIPDAQELAEIIGPLLPMLAKVSAVAYSAPAHVVRQVQDRCLPLAADLALVLGAVDFREDEQISLLGHVLSRDDDDKGKHPERTPSPTDRVPA